MGKGEELLEGSADEDVLYGGSGDDTLRGEGGKDEYFGGSGEDTLHVSDEDKPNTDDTNSGFTLSNTGRKAVASGAHHLSTLDSFSAPTITGAPASVKEGEVIRILGSGFGSAGNVAPLVWDTVETGSFSSWWATHNDLSESTDHNRHAFSKFNGHLNFTANARDGYFIAPNAVHPRWFVQYWFRISENWDWGTTDHDGDDRFLANVKLYRLWNPSDTVKENLHVVFQGDAVPGGHFRRYKENVNPKGDSYFLKPVSQTVTKGEWHLLPFEFSENSAPGVANGHSKIWFDGRLVSSRTNLITCQLFPHLKFQTHHSKGDRISLDRLAQ
jgi:hypothetical protein